MAIPPTSRTPPERTSLQQEGASPDILINCGGQTFPAHKVAICPQSQKLQDACDATVMEATVVVQEDAFDAPTMRRMLDFMYHSEYTVGIGEDGATVEDERDTQKNLDVLCHLFCFAIAESYQVQEMSTYALDGFKECLGVVSPEDFSDLMGIIAAHTQAKPVHAVIRDVAHLRIDELAMCKRFNKVLACRHILDQDASRDLRAAKQIAAHGSILFRIANKTKQVTGIEKTKLIRAYQEALQKIHRVRLQIDKDSSAPVHDEQVHNDDSKHALQASEAAAEQATGKLAKAEEQGSGLVKAMRKMKLELQVLHNAEHNNKNALERAEKETATITQERDQAVVDKNATMQMLNKANQEFASRFDQVVAENMALEKVKQEHEQAARGRSLMTSRVAANQEYIDMRSRLDKLVAENAALSTIKQERDQIREEQRATARQLEMANQESVGLRSRNGKLMADNVALQNQSKNDRTLISEGEKMLVAARQQNETIARQTTNAPALIREVNEARLTIFTLRRTIYDMQCLILNNADSNQQLLPYGQPGYSPQ